MESFVFETPPRIVFGWGTADRLPAEVRRLGRRPLVVTGRSLRAAGVLEPLLDALRAGGLEPLLHEGVPPEPDLAAVDAARCAAEGADCVLAIGGGSPLDVGKAAAALAGAEGSARDYWTGSLAVPSRGLPIAAAPTTAGTGSEVTYVSVLVDPETRRKASIRGSGMMPAVAVVDPRLTLSCPPAVTAHSGMDAWVQAVESFTSRGANDLTEPLALRAAKLAWDWLETAFREPEHRQARESMAMASMLAGIALNTSRLGLVHGLAHPLGAVTGAAHGLLCGLLMPPVMRFNREAVREKYAFLSRELGIAGARESDETAAEALIEATCDRLVRLGIPLRLSEVGFRADDLDWIAAETLPSGSTKANPRAVTLEDARAVAASCL